MMLHNNKELFEQVVLKTSEALGIEAGIVEKDYFVTLFLKELTKRQPDIIFKGGTSLSECYKIIDRFSEDIDLNIISEGKPGEARRRNLKKSIVETIEQLGFFLANPTDIRSRRDFNRYNINYPSKFSVSALKPQLIVETAVFFRAYPINRMTASSFIYDFLWNSGYQVLAQEYDLFPFEINVQSAERTFVDKIFALGDYYLSGKIEGHSRHIYDLYKLLEIVELNDEVRLLFEHVREERGTHKTCLSAKDDVDMMALLQKIKETEVYRNDYENITMKLLFKSIKYEEVVAAIEATIDFLSNGTEYLTVEIEKYEF